MAVGGLEEDVEHVVAAAGKRRWRHRSVLRHQLLVGEQRRDRQRLRHPSRSKRLGRQRECRTPRISSVPGGEAEPETYPVTPQLPSEPPGITRRLDSLDRKDQAGPGPRRSAHPLAPSFNSIE